jgi:hypothetical protein
VPSKRLQMRSIPHGMFWGWTSHKPLPLRKESFQAIVVVSTIGKEPGARH